jgi:hypothetical protein
LLLALLARVPDGARDREDQERNKIMTTDKITSRMDRVTRDPGSVDEAIEGALHLGTEWGTHLAIIAVAMAVSEQTAVLRTIAGDVAHLRSALTHG